jgi:hypothetical protein
MKRIAHCLRYAQKKDTPTILKKIKDFLDMKLFPFSLSGRSSFEGSIIESE